MSGDPLVNFEAEVELLGGLMRDNDAVERVADLVEAQDFSEPIHCAIYSAIVREAALGKPANPVSLRGYFENYDGMSEFGGVAYLAKLTASCSMLVTQEVAKQVADLSSRRRMRKGLAIAADACADLTLTPAELVNQADAALLIGGTEAIHQPTGGECFTEMIEGFKRTTPGVECGVIPELDRLLGPMRPKQLVIGAGRPGMGKTAMALSYAIGAAKAGHGVLFVSLEMSSEELAARMAADMCFDGQSAVPFSAIRDGDLNDRQYRRIIEAKSDMDGLPFQVVDVGSLTVGRLSMLIRRHARRMAASGHKLELVIVDYLQLLSPDTKGRSNYEAVSEVSRALKAMAKDHGVAVFALAQLSREVEKRPDRRPQLSDLRDSGQIEQDADAVLFLFRQEYYLNQSERDATSNDRLKWESLMDRHRGKIEFIVAKRRNGITGSATGQFHGAYQAVR